MPKEKEKKNSNWGGLRPGSGLPPLSEDREPTKPISTRLTLSQIEAVKKARGKQSEAEWVREAILEKLAKG